MKEFELLKRTYPVSEQDRTCDGFIYILDNTSTEERLEWRINARELQCEIKAGEKYIYQVAKVNKVFRIWSLSFSNYAIIKKHIIKFDDDE